MAASITKEIYMERFHPLNGDAPKLRAQFEVTLDSVYVAGGEAVDFTAGGEIDAVESVSIDSFDNGAVGGYAFGWDLSASKIVVFNSGTTDALFNEAGADDLSAVVVVCTVIGTIA